MEIATRQAGVVSCDVVGHSSSGTIAVQFRTVEQLNGVVRRALQRAAGEVVWASGGDGGHVLFFGDEWHAEAVALISELRTWSQSEGVPLRIAGHLGEVVTLIGADDRVQPVGDGINEAGAILDMAGDAGIVTSQAFRAAIEGRRIGDCDFHDERTLLLRGRRPMVLSMMSLPSLSSEWPPPDNDDRLQMNVATERGDAWNTLYHAKRLLQLNAADREVEVILRQLRPFDFWHQASENGPSARTVNPFFAYLQARSLREVIRSSQLVERGYNDVLCRYGDEGHAMFLVLRGQVGVYNSEGASTRIGRPEFTMGVGEIAGELAFLLDRERTADLVALSDVALLSFSFQELSRQLTSAPGSEDVIELVQRFMAQRILQHVGHNADCLIGKRGEGPLAQDLMPAESLLDDLYAFCRIVSLNALDGNISLQTLRQGGEGGAGIFFLVSGRVVSKVSPERSLSGSDFPLIFVDWSPTLLGPDHEYAVEAGKAKLLQITQEGLDQLPDLVRRGLGRKLRLQVAKNYLYDAFLSYNLGDEGSVQYWKEALEQHGLSVYVDSLRPGVRFPSGIQRALLDSLTHVVLVSPHTMAKDLESNWLLKEVHFREANMRHPAIVPVALRGGNLDRLGLRYTAVDATGDPDKAIGEVIELIQELRRGERKPPVLANRTLEQLLH